MAGHGQLKFVMTECMKTQIRLMGLVCKVDYQEQLFSRAKLFARFIKAACLII